MRISSKKWFIAAIVFTAIVVLFLAFVGIYTYIAEINEIGTRYLSVLWTNLRTGIAAAVSVFLFTFISALIFNKIIRKNLSKMVLTETLFDRRLFTYGTSLAVGIIISLYSSAEIYKNVLLALNSSSAGVADPIFSHDISYYMFVRPLLISLRNLLSGIFTLLLFYSIASYYYYLVRTSQNIGLKKLFEEKGVVRHLLITAAIIFFIKAVSYKFNMENLLFASSSRVGGGYTDMKIWLNFYRIIPFILLLVIIFSFVFLFRSKYKAMLITIAVYPLSFIIAGASAGIVQQLIVKPNEGSVESTYIKYNIDATRRAYNLADADELEYPAEDNLTADTINKNREITDNIRITDHLATITAFNQLQGIRNYYQFMDADVVPYTENGQRKAAFMSVRELSQTGDLSNATYVNRRMKYTHGYGIVKSPVNKVTAEGQPDFLIKNMPLVYENTNIKVSQPRIYFGETPNEYYVVNTSQSELDFSSDSVEHEYSYKGSAGIHLSAFNRFIYAVKHGDPNLITSNYISGKSRMIVNNNVLQRVRKAAPFIKFDDDIHISISNDGSLKWIVDGYTYSRYYPYSQYTDDNFNYVRNSVKAVVDAFDGTVTIYIIDKNDPIIKTYSKIYPNVFSDKPFPADLETQVKYPEWLFKIQAQIFTKYHVTNPAIFYAGSDIWAVAREKYGENSNIQNVEPYYNIVSLRNGKPEFVIMIPYTLKNKDNNLVGWLGARTDNGNYGKFISYSFPTGKHIYGTLQVENKIDNEPDISKEITLWSQGGSAVMRGNMLVIPIKNSIIYVEPLYITSQNSASLPEVKRIVVAYGDTIVMEPSLEAAFAKLFGTTAETAPLSGITGTTQPTGKGVSAGNDETLKQIRDEYSNLKKAAAGGDWESFGKSMKKLGELLD
ncbi:MAG: UPF0182 family protein [Bacillota bacterium]|nr:UPF0182 family protein [Bacillota bacterium]